MMRTPQYGFTLIPEDTDVTLGEFRKAIAGEEDSNFILLDTLLSMMATKEYVNELIGGFEGAVSQINAQMATKEYVNKLIGDFESVAVQMNALIGA